jgi:hydroxyacyl-ACP dehydratase HTD2-like protein with hotdog domain
MRSGMGPGTVSGEQVISRMIQPDEVSLFLFSAATWLPHRIHYDRDYAMSEGHRDLLVHGPLQGSYLVQMVHEWLAQRGGVLESFRYRHVAPAYVGRELLCRAAISPAAPTADRRYDAWQFDLSITDVVDERTTTTGAAFGRSGQMTA